MNLAIKQLPSEREPFNAFFDFYKSAIAREAGFECAHDIERLFMKTLLPAYAKILIS